VDNIDRIKELIYASILHAGDEQNDNDRVMPRLVDIERDGDGLSVELTDGLHFRIVAVCEL